MIHRGPDIKSMYQDKAEEIAEAMHNLDFHELGAAEQMEVYALAVESVDDSIRATADALMEIEKYRCRGR